MKKEINKENILMEEVLKTVKKIDEKKRKIKTALDETTETLRNFDTDNSLSLDDLLSGKTISRSGLYERKRGLETALNLPYYAEKEYREKCIKWAEAETKKTQAQVNEINNEIEKRESEIEQAKEEIRCLRNKRDDIKIELSTKASHCGLAGSIANEFFRCQDLNHALRVMKEEFKKYN